MRIDRRFLGWGVFFIVLGSVPLAVRGGVLTADAAGTLWRLWPLFLVGSGIGLLLRDRRAAVVGGLIVSITFGLIGGGLLAGGWGELGAIACGDTPASGQTGQQSGDLDPIARVTLDHRCGDLNVRMTDAAGWTLHSSGGDVSPDVSTSASDLRIGSGGHRVIVFPGTGAPREIWNISLPKASTIDLTTTLNAASGRFDLRGGHFGSIATTVNAGDMRIDLEGTTVSRLELRLNAGDTRIVLPASSLTGDLTVNAGSIRLCAPAGVGLRFTTNDSNITSSFDFDGAGLVKSGSTWTSPEYATAAVKIDLSTTANAGSVALNPAEGCR
jgi:hypothetical protein